MDDLGASLASVTFKGAETFIFKHISQTEVKTNSCRCIALKLPNGVRNISKKFNNSNNIILSAEDKLAVSGIRQEIIVWDMDTGCLVKRLIAHFQVSFFLL